MMPSHLLKLVCFFLAVFLTNSQDYEENWSYAEAANWKDTDSTCAGSNQSPIDIKTADVVRDDSKEVTFTYWDKSQPNLINYHLRTNHSAVYFTDKMEAMITFNRRSYRITGIEYHWGSDASKGSAHSVDGHFYAGEAQIMLLNVRYGEDFDTAISVHDGIAGISFFFNENKDLTEDIPIVKGYTKVLGELATQNFIIYNTTTNKYTLNDVLPADRSAYRYKGSLQRPPCTENVEWVVLKTPIDVTTSFMDAFRALKDDAGNFLYNNVRPIQDNQAITVYRV